MKNGTPITEQEATKLIDEGVASLFNCSMYGGFFEARPEARQDIIVVVTDEDYFIRAREDLVKSDDEVFVGFVEDGDKPPNFEDIFEVREL